MELTQEIVRELIDYDASTGIPIWKERGVKWFKDGKGRYTKERNQKVWNSKFAGTEALGAPKDSGHKHGYIFSKKYPQHVIIWFWWYGIWPEEIDHENGCPWDNKISNLRNVTHQENCKNQPKRSNNSSGFMGVHKSGKIKRPWKVAITSNKTRLAFRYFEDVNEAAVFAKEMYEKLDFHQNHGERELTNISDFGRTS